MKTIQHAARMIACRYFICMKIPLSELLSDLIKRSPEHFELLAGDGKNRPNEQRITTNTPINTI